MTAEQAVRMRGVRLLLGSVPCVGGRTAQPPLTCASCPQHCGGFVNRAYVTRDVDLILRGQCSVDLVFKLGVEE